MEVVSYDGKKVLWGVLDFHGIEEEPDRGDFGLQGFDF